MLKVLSCFSWLYIFWFLHQTTTLSISFCFSLGCISFDSYIKPQLLCNNMILQYVVYLLIPTSNHNPMSYVRAPGSVVYLLIPTSNHNMQIDNIRILMLYIFWFLHQTTTHVRFRPSPARCISFDSYIKPQLSALPTVWAQVVYLLIPTSNHNSTLLAIFFIPLYIFWFLHQTTTNWYESILY